MSADPCGCDQEANHTCDGCTIAALTKRVRSLEGEIASPGLSVRSRIAHLLTGRCNNCYDSLPGAVGCSVHSPGWNWVTPNFGPFCDECIKEVKG